MFLAMSIPLGDSLENPEFSLQDFKAGSDQSLD